MGATFLAPAAPPAPPVAPNGGEETIEKDINFTQICLTFTTPLKLGTPPIVGSSY